MKFIIPLSAKSSAALNRNISNLHDFLDDGENLSKKIDVENIAYTLQIGRDAMNCRAAFIVGSIPELVKKLDVFLNGKNRSGLDGEVFVGEIKNIKSRTKDDGVHQDILKGWLLQADLAKIAEHWTLGQKIDWQFLYTRTTPTRISLPTYSFEKERYWPKFAQSSPINTNPPRDSEKMPSLQTKVSGLDLQKKVESDLIDVVHRLLKISLDKLDVNTNLADFGFDSISLVKCARGISAHFNLKITPAQLFSNLTISTLASYLQEEYRDEIGKFFAEPVSTKLNASKIDVAGEVSEKIEEPPDRSNTEETVSACEVGTDKKNIPSSSGSVENNTDINKGHWPVAIIGMSGKFPQSDDLEKYWDNLLQGRNCISEISNERRDWQTYHDESSGAEENIIWGGFIEGIKKFDPEFFGLSDEEAEMMDPQQRLLLTYAYKAIEDAGYDPRALTNTAAGVFVAIGDNGYNDIVANSGKEFDGRFLTGSLPSVGPNRVSYFFDLHGPSEPVETACASSLVAIHRAINEINNGVCDIAIVGGVNLIVTPYGHAVLNKAGLLSKEGKCKPFSSDADGFVRAEGIGVIVLKRLNVAEKDNDRIYAVIRGSGVNHNGRANFLTAPNPKAQSALLESVYKRAGIDINTVTYIETHGTGTELGDAVEIEGLRSAFKKLGYKKTSEKDGPGCAIGSVKSNIGHTELASGMASIIKVLCQMKNKTLVKTIHCETVNPYLNLEESPFFIVRKNQKWDVLNDKSGVSLPRRAGVSAFGLSGVNAHVVLEEYVDERASTTRESLPKYKFRENDYWAAKRIDRADRSVFNASKLNAIENGKLFSRWYG